MFKKLLSRSVLALSLSLTLLAVPTTRLYAQSDVVSGGDPQPTGESVTAVPTSTILLTILAVLGLS